jgi:hypothetical protein
MLKRIAIYCMGFLFICLLIFGYFWRKERQVRAELTKEVNKFFAEQSARTNGLNSFGDVDLNPPELTLAKLEEKLHQPTLTRPGADNTTRLGWACGGEHCAITAAYLIPFGQEIPPGTAPAVLLIDVPPFGELNHRFAIGGIQLWENADDMERSMQNQGRGHLIGMNHATWDKDWSFVWSGTDGKISILSFMNDTEIESAKARRDANSSASGKKAAK